MFNKQLEKKIKLQPNESGADLRYPVELEYYLLEDDINDCEDLAGERAYGIEIVKKEVKNEKSEIERKSVRNFSCSREKTRQILDRLAVNSVTPVGLPFILDDIVGI